MVSPTSSASTSSDSLAADLAASLSIATEQSSPEQVARAILCADDDGASSDCACDGPDWDDEDILAGNIDKHNEQVWQMYQWARRYARRIDAVLTDIELLVDDAPEHREEMEGLVREQQEQLTKTWDLVERLKGELNLPSTTSEVQG